MIGIEYRQVAAVAAKELRDRLRNRWVLAVAVVFAVFSLVISYFGGAEQGTLGPRSIEFVITSLVSLVIYLIPLIALLQCPMRSCTRWARTWTPAASPATPPRFVSRWPCSATRPIRLSVRRGQSGTRRALPLR